MTPWLWLVAMMRFATHDGASGGNRFPTTERFFNNRSKPETSPLTPPGRHVSIFAALTISIDTPCGPFV